MLIYSALLAQVALASLQPLTPQKLGVYDYMTEESSPLVFNGALLMLESIPTAYAGFSPAFAGCSSYLRVRDMRTLGVIVNISATCGQAFGAAVVIPGAPGASDTLVVTSTQWDRRSATAPPALGWSGPCAGAAANCTVNLFASSSPSLADATWVSRAPGIALPQLGVYNTDLAAVPPAAALPWRWVMALETTAERARFLASTAGDPLDLSAWALLSDAHTVPRLPDVGSCPSLRHDGAFFYYLSGGTNIHILRSADLVAWEEAPQLVLNHSSPGDCVVAPAHFGPYLPTGEAAAHLAACGPLGNFGDDSDVDLVEWPAPFGSNGGGPAVLLEYGSGDQRTFGFSNLAMSSNTTLNAFLQSFFPPAAAAAAPAGFPSWQQPFLDPLLPPYGGAPLLSPATTWQRLFYGTLEPGTGAYAMSPMLSYLNGNFLASWKLSVASEDEPGQRVMYAQSSDGVAWRTSSDGRSNELFPGMNSSENPRVALFAEPTLLLNGRVYAAASPKQFCLYPAPFPALLLLRRVYDDAPGHLGPIFWAAPTIPPGFALASARHNISALPAQDAQTQGDVGSLTPHSTSPPCARDGSTSKCEFCTGGCQDWAVALNVSSLENERSHWRVPGGSGAEVLLYRSHQRVLYASVRPTPHDAWPVPAPTNITDDVANFNAGNFPAAAGLDGRPFLVSNALITLLRDPLFLSTAPDGYAFSTVAAIGSCEDAAVFASPAQPWGCQYRNPGGAKEGGLQYPQAVIVAEPAAVQGLYVVVSLNKEDIWISRTPLSALPGYSAP